MSPACPDSFRARRTLTVAGTSYDYYALAALAEQRPDDAERALRLLPANAKLLGDAHRRARRRRRIGRDRGLAETAAHMEGHRRRCGRVQGCRDQPALAGPVAAGRP